MGEDVVYWHKSLYCWAPPELPTQNYDDFFYGKHAWFHEIAGGTLHFNYVMVFLIDQLIIEIP